MDGDEVEMGLLMPERLLNAPEPLLYGGNGVFEHLRCRVLPEARAGCSSRCCSSRSNAGKVWRRI